MRRSDGVIAVISVGASVAGRKTMNPGAPLRPRRRIRLPGSRVQGERLPAGGVVYTRHRIPLTRAFIAYCPRVDPLAIETEALKASLAENGCVNVNFDVPNVVRGSAEEAPALEALSGSEENLLEEMHPKHRYNVEKLFHRSRKFVRTLWDTFRPGGDAFLLVAEHGKTPLAA